MNKKHIDINSDLGEGIGFDHLLMPLISSCSIACGGHFGNENTIKETVRLAQEHGVKVGAHPSFPDRDNFGRKVLTLTKQELKNAVYEQLMSFYAVCEKEKEPVHHIKLHGALYNYAAKDAPTADAVVEAIIATKVRPKLYVAYGSVLHRKAENLLPLVFEAFIDRAYNDDLSLADRTVEGAIITSPNAAWNQFYQMIEKGTINTISSLEKSIRAHTFCMHGDTKNAVVILNFLHRKMKEHGIILE